MRNHLLYLVVCFSTIPAFADVATTAYVDSMRATVQSEIDGLVNKDGFEPNLVLQTDSNGNVTAGLVKTNMIADGAIQTMHIADGEITDADLAAGLGLDKLDWGTLPTDGNLYIPIWNSATNMYVFELYNDGVLHCKAPSYDVGAEMCINKDTAPNAYGYWNNRSNEASATNCVTCKAKGDWELRYTSGAYAGTTLSGKTLCCHIIGTYGVAGNPIVGYGGHCWCKLDNNGVVSRWVYLQKFDSWGTCNSDCAFKCSYNYFLSSYLRVKTFETMNKN